jgi:hypothetical protein
MPRPRRPPETGAWRPRLPRRPPPQRKAPAEAASGPEIEALDPAPYTREAGYSVEHRGFGRWYVVGPDGATVSGPHQRAVIEHLMA